ncbi:methyltransferase, FkbM family [Methylobacterium phyllostachyos]|uniref:Methyltransferase, FkbM family n=1 Tax=Methylobacterium phyllostachyos TaxID=582672 RepID=A0A1G9R9J9_9HYPH|nr:FkbM family methyltransferase [Methylobacterium phyllostachyos]SDM19821.1 methyltransferase, FkbM family [Methylobacterium phyllostachyos]
MGRLSTIANRRVKNLFRRLGYDLYRRRPNIYDFLRAREVDLFLDVGANSGQTGLRLRQLGYEGKIVSFEPVGDAFRHLKGHSEQDANWQAHNFALGDVRRTSSINVSENSVFTSLLAQTPEAQRYDTAAIVAHKETINIERLDDIYEPYSDSRVFLKIVTQGYERRVLAGAQRSLQKIVGVELILPLVQIYEDNWSIAEAFSHMEDLGFTLAQIDSEIYGKSDPTCLLEAYCIFRRIDQ